MPRVAVIDDDFAVRKAPTLLLAAASYDVRTFGSAREFIDALTRDVPACALADVQMPEMTGLELQLHLAHSGFGIPTILMTAHDEPGSRARCIAAGATAYLIKPVQKAALISAIEWAIGHA